MIAGYGLAICTFVASLVAIILKSGVTAMHRWLLTGSVGMSAAGIFVGVIWANVSWGCYWSWDPKETRALITLMVYAVPLHNRLIPLFSRPKVYHLYIIISLLTDRSHHLLGSKHADGWHAQLRIAVHVLMATENLCLLYYALQLQKV